MSEREFTRPESSLPSPPSARNSLQAEAFDLMRDAAQRNASPEDAVRRTHSDFKGPDENSKTAARQGHLIMTDPYATP